MAENHRRLVAFARYALLGTLAGVLIGALAGLALEKFMPPRFAASLVVFHPPGSGWSDSGRDFVAATLARPDFLPGVANAQGWSADVAADLARKITTTAADASRPLAELRLTGTDGDALSNTLDAVVEHMIALHRSRQQADLDAQLEALDTALASARRHVSESGDPPADAATLPDAARHALTAAARLARQRRELELSKRFRLSRGARIDDRRRELSLRGLERQLERGLDELELRDAAAVARFEHARERAIAAAEVDALQHIRDGLVREFNTLFPLRIVRAAEVTPLATDASVILMLAAFGALTGLFAGGFVWSANQSSPRRLSAASVEKSLHVPVLAVMSADLADAGERYPLAQTNPQHLALAAIRSLRIALAVRHRDTGASAPVVFSGPDDPHTARLVVANLALVTAQAGERVLVIDAAPGDDGFTEMFAAADGDDEVHFGAGSVRLASGDHAAGIFTGGALFDHIFVHVQDTTRALEYISKHGAGIAVLVCAQEQPLAALRKRQASKAFGVVLTGHRIDEAAYGGGHGAAHANPA